MSEQSILSPACWWCGGLADSREHRVKRTVLTRMFDAGAPYLILDTKPRPASLKGPGAKAIRFPKVLCLKCNNEHSQPFDRAYDIFTSKIWDDPEYFRNRLRLPWQDIFPHDPQGPANLCRYYTKNIACRIAETGFAVPAELVDFMNGASMMPHTTIVLFRDFSTFDAHRRHGGGGNYPFANRGFMPVSPDEGPLQAFVAEIQDGPVGVLYWYGATVTMGINFCSQPVVPLRDRYNLPHHEVHESQWDSAELLNHAIDEANLAALLGR